jgi:hypothetical protein
MQNYMKTSSSTFEPKQSDMTYWYNTVTGYTLVAEKDINTATLQNLLPTEIRYGEPQSAFLTEWIDLSSTQSLPDIHLAKVEAFKNYSPSSDALVMEFYLPNPKYNDIDLSKIYILSDRNGDPDEVLDMEHATVRAKFKDQMVSASEEYISQETGQYIKFRIGIRIDDAIKDTKVKMRLCYEYTENGVTKYAYTPYMQYSYNELPEVTKE